jgi:4-hydroxy-2-oxoheptanedioate aldolase
MPVRLTLDATLSQALAAAGRPLFGMWVCSRSALVAEVCAGSGLDVLLFDAEHGPNDLGSLLPQLQAVHGYPVVPMVRPPTGDAVLLKQYLDLGVQNLLVPMIDTAEQAAAMAAAVSYPPDGVRGIGSAFARGARWGRVDGYLHNARNTISLFVQIESVDAVRNVEAILAVDGIDGIFCGPSDLAASMGLLGQQEHPDVVAAIEHCIAAANAAGKPCGVNAFNPDRARQYAAAGARFVLVGADVSILTRESDRLAALFLPPAAG